MKFQRARNKITNASVIVGDKNKRLIKPMYFKSSFVEKSSFIIKNQNLKVGKEGFEPPFRAPNAKRLLL